jgi:hypothetical protein
MGRRIFDERKFSVSGRVLPLDAVRLFSDGGYEINPELIPYVIEKAEEVLEKEIPQLYATEYMMFLRNGNRNIYEASYFERRDMMLTLAIAEYIEKKGRFTDKLINVTWLILEETSWVIPAHNKQKKSMSCPLPYAFRGDADFVDLFSAATGADLAVVYYLCRDAFDAVTPLINERILFELECRIVKPYLDDRCVLENFWWTGISGKQINNWCPWIISNLLTVAAMAVKNDTERTLIVHRSLPFLDNFTELYHPDGGCDEGPSYWGAAGGALFDCLVLLDRLTDGYVNVFDDPLIKNMGEYIVKVTVNRDRVLNFADSPAKLSPSGTLVYHWGRAVGSDMMANYAAWRLDEKLFSISSRLGFHPFRTLKNLTTPRLPREELCLPQRAFIGGIDVAVTRESDKLNTGLYLALKGGHNKESHNHNDVGNFIVFADDKPIFIDCGSGTYTKKTFSSDRYSIWAMRSEYHNCATVNGYNEQVGADAFATVTEYDGKTGRMTLDLTTAYPADAGLRSYTRSAVLENSTVIVEDNVEFLNTGSVVFNLITTATPDEVGDGYFVLQGRRVEFDRSLCFESELLDNSEPETEAIPARWDTDRIRRITLRTAKDFQKGKFILKIK